MKNRTVFAEGGADRGCCREGPAPFFCIQLFLQLSLTFTMAVATSRTLLALFLTFSAPGCGWTDKARHLSSTGACFYVVFLFFMHVFCSDLHLNLLAKCNFYLKKELGACFVFIYKISPTKRSIKQFIFTLFVND